MSEIAEGGSAEQSQAVFEQALELVTLTGERLAFTARRLRVSGEAAQRACELTLEAAWTVYAALTAGEWMGLAAAARGGETGSGFEPGRPVELTARLKPAVQRALWPDGAELDAERALRALLGEAAAAQVLLRHSESWLVAEAKQRVDVPAELAGGVLKQGYRTLWADAGPWPPAPSARPAALSGQPEASTPQEPAALQPAWPGQRAAAQPLQAPARTTPPEVAPPAPHEGRAVGERALQAVAAGYLQHVGLPAEPLSASLLRIAYADEAGAWTMLVLTDEADQVCIVYSLFPTPVPVERRTELAVFLNAENYDLALGSFELDPADGELRFRTSLDVEGDRLSEALFARLFGMNAGIMMRYYAELAERIGS
ncbi:YbjN domain-containing protein [Paenibacillus athensensis]|nr:YbjN domain-containing protein [Paenibacillus athensensis]MCD1261701.1 YbjN domain-containing protein [Paenibacillus athensensis]